MHSILRSGCCSLPSAGNNSFELSSILCLFPMNEKEEIIFFWNQYKTVLPFFLLPLVHGSPTKRNIRVRVHFSLLLHITLCLLRTEGVSTTKHSRRWLCSCHRHSGHTRLDRSSSAWCRTMNTFASGLISIAATSSSAWSHTMRIHCFSFARLLSGSSACSVLIVTVTTVQLALLCTTWSRIICVIWIRIIGITTLRFGNDETTINCCFKTSIRLLGLCVLLFQTIRSISGLCSWRE